MADSDLTKESIIGSIRRSKVKLSSFGAKSIGLFGSFVRKQVSPDSDIDILVEFDSDKKKVWQFY